MVRWILIKLFKVLKHFRNGVLFLCPFIRGEKKGLFKEEKATNQNTDEWLPN